MMPRLIDDLIPCILSNHDHWWMRDLLRLILISPAWVWPVRKIIYNSPILRTFGSIALLARTLSANRSLVPLVHDIEICADLLPGHCGLFSDDGIASLKILFGFITVRSIKLGGLLSYESERILHKISYPSTITELHIHGNIGWNDERFGRTPSLKWDDGLARKFSNLRVLNLSNIDLTIVHPSVPYTIELTDLILDNVHITSGFLPHLMHESWSSLRRLSVRTDCASEFHAQLRFALDCCGASLNSLQFEAEDSQYAEPMFDPTRYPGLRWLHLNGVNIDLATLSSIAQCCAHLEELSVVGRGVHLAPSDWVSLLSSNALPRLCHLTLPWGTNHPPFLEWTREAAQVVLDAATTRNIHVSPPIRL